MSVDGRILLLEAVEDRLERLALRAGPVGEDRHASADAALTASAFGAPSLLVAAAAAGGENEQERGQEAEQLEAGSCHCEDPPFVESS
jgi:hypothetical protein